MFLAIVPQRLADPSGTQNVVTYNNLESYPAWRVSFRVWTGGDWDLDPVTTNDA